MSETPRGVDASSGYEKVGPDYFGFYAREAAELLARDEGLIPFSPQDLAGGTHGITRDRKTVKQTYDDKGSDRFSISGSLFCDVIGAGHPDFKKERLKALLRESVNTLTQEVDEMVDSVFSMCQIRYLRHKKNLSTTEDEDDEAEHPQKKLKLSSSSSFGAPLSTSPSKCRIGGEENLDVVVPGKAVSNGNGKGCGHCHMAETTNWGNGIDTRTEAEKGNEEMDDDLKLLLENEGQMVEVAMRKYSDELSTELGRMEEKLEELLDTVMSSFRSMTRGEKHQLRNLIQKLSPDNLDRVVELIQQRKLSDDHSRNEIHVDLAEEDNVTLWRLYYYVKTVESARKLIDSTVP